MPRSVLYPQVHGIVAARADFFVSPAHVLSCGHDVEAMVLALLGRHHALYKARMRLERGMLSLL